MPISESAQSELATNPKSRKIPGMFVADTNFMDGTRGTCMLQVSHVSQAPTLKTSGCGELWACPLQLQSGDFHG